LSHQVPPTFSDFSKIVNEWMPARFILTPAAMPPKPQPTTTTRGVPAGPNSSVLRFTRRLLFSRALACGC
jgi:hypothetical protein